MIIQKVDIKSTNKHQINQGLKLIQSKSTYELPQINNLSHKYNLPYLSNDTKIKKNNIKLSYINSFDMRNFAPNSEINIVFKPKRIIISKEKKETNETSFINMRNLPLNENKAFKSMMDNNNPDAIEFSSIKSNEFYDEDNSRLKNYAFRYTSLLKLEKNIKYFNTFKNNSNLISKNKLGIFDDLISKIYRTMCSQKTLFEHNLLKLENKNKYDTNNNNENNETNLENNNSNVKIYDDKLTFVEKLIRKELASFYNYNSLMNKLLTILFEEISLDKEKIFKLLQKNHEEELIINSTNKSLNELNNYINRYDVDTRINYVKNQEIKRNKMKEIYKKKQNELINKNYQLENEIKIMATILNKNKMYYNKYKEFEEKIDINKKESEQMKRAFRKEIREKNFLVEEEMHRKEELKEELSNIKKTLDHLKKEKKHNKNNDIQAKNNINKLENLINQKNENIRMLNEELEWFLRQNYNLKKKIKDREFTILTLEMKIKKDKEKESILNNNSAIPSTNLDEGKA